MNMNSYLATRTLDRFVYKSDTALLLTQSRHHKCDNQSDLRFDTAAQKRSKVEEHLKSAHWNVVIMSSDYVFIWFISLLVY